MRPTFHVIFQVVGRAAAVGFALIIASGALDAESAWRPFSPGSPWNQRIAPDAATDPNSPALIEDLASRGSLHVNIRDWSIPVYFVDAAQTPRHAVLDSRPGVHGAGFEFPRAIPIPDHAVASPPVGEDSDNHLSIIDRRLNLEWGMWAARRNADGAWTTGLGAVTNLAGSGVAPPWFQAGRELDAHRARAGGFPLIAGLIFVDEIKAGRIEHALCFAYDHCLGGFFVPPASTAQARFRRMSNDLGIPMGGRIQLDPNWDVAGSGLSSSGQIIARALQEYGAYCGDYADATVIYAENSPAAVAQWEGLLATDELAAVFTPEFIREHFRVLDMGSLLPGQNCEIPPPYVLSFAVMINGQPVSARIDPFTRTIGLTLPPDIETTRFAASFELYPKTGFMSVAGVPQTSGVTTQDFAQPVSYMLTTQDGRHFRWSVSVQPSTRATP